MKNPEFVKVESCSLFPKWRVVLVSDGFWGVLPPHNERVIGRFSSREDAHGEAVRLGRVHSEAEVAVRRAARDFVDGLSPVEREEFRVRFERAEARGREIMEYGYFG